MNSQTPMLPVVQPRANDCTKCALRLDGTYKTFCYHERFESEGTDGRPILMYPKTPSWCPGMLAEAMAVVELVRIHQEDPGDANKICALSSAKLPPRDAP